MFDRLGWAAFLLALIPAVVRLPRTRSLLRHINDPALAERMTGSRTLMVFAFSSILAAEIILWPRQLWWVIPVMFVTFALAGWPLRRALFAETWSFGSYLWFYVRLVLVIYGFWLLLMSTPWIQYLDVMRGWPIAVMFGVVLLIWGELYGVILRWALRTRPVSTPSLVERFNAIAAKTTIPPPRIEYVDLKGGAFVNALALPGIKRPSVLFTGTLLERLDEEEVEAIFAHEVAHLEHYSVAYLKKWRPLGWLLVAATISVRPLSLTVSPAFEWVAMVWPLVVIVYMSARGHKQKHETESDVRAVALTGKPEVMVRALIKLHELLKLPRRLDPSVEVSASHPSLARRIQAIRNASGSTAGTLAEPVTFRHESTAVTLHADRLVWAEGEVTAHTLAYASLDELRIDVDAAGAMRLVASDPAGRKWTMPLAVEEVPRVQAALNLVDVHLRPAPAGARRSTVLMRLVAVWAAMFALSATQFAAVIIALLAIISPERPLLRAAATAGGAAALLTALTALYGQAAFAWLLLMPAVVLLLLSYRDKRDAVSRTSWRLVAAIGLFASLLLIPILLSAVNWLTLHQAARKWSGLAVISIAFAAANWPRRSAAWRAATAAAITIGVTTIALGTTRAADVLVDDPFLSHGARIEPQAVPSTPDARFQLDVVPEDIFLSPNALAIAAMTEDDYEEYVFHIGRPGKPLTDVNADTAVFVDDDRLLLLDHDRETARVSLVHADHPEPPLWTSDIKLSGATLSVGRDRRSWQLLGTADDGTFQRVIGTMEGSGSPDASWRIEKSAGNGQLIPLLALDSRLLVRKVTYDRRGIVLPGLSPTWQAWLDPWRTESRFIRIDNASQRELLDSQLDVDCALRPIAGEDPICWGYDGSRTHLFTVDIDGRLGTLAVMPQRISVDASRGWIHGWARRPYAMHTATGRLYQMEYRRGFFIADGDFLGVVASRANAANVELYRISAR